MQQLKFNIWLFTLLFENHGNWIFSEKWHRKSDEWNEFLFVQKEYYFSFQSRAFLPEGTISWHTEITATRNAFQADIFKVPELQLLNIAELRFSFRLC